MSITVLSPVPAAHAPLARRILGAMRSGIAALFLVALGIYILGPLAILFLWAFARQWYAPSLWPQGLTLSWWQSVLMAPNLGHSILLSFLIAPAVTVATALICLPAAYAFARYRYPGRRSFLVSIFAIHSFPKMGIYITLAEMFYGLHLIDTFPGVVIIQMLGTVVTMVWIPAAAFASVLRVLEEAARDNGAGPLRTFLSVTLPQAAPGILIAVILTFLSSLDEAQGTFIVGAPNYQTMPVVMYSLVSGYPEQAAAVFSILLTLPSLILLFLVRRYIVGGSFASAFRLR